MRVPETRASLILRLPSREDADAWREFVAIYEPFVYRFARRNGFQEADARELVQNVLVAVVKAVGRWQADAERARFRTWLFTIARNQFLDLLAKKRRPAGSQRVEQLRRRCSNGSRPPTTWPTSWRSSIGTSCSGGPRRGSDVRASRRPGGPFG